MFLFACFISIFSGQLQATDPKLLLGLCFNIIKFKIQQLFPYNFDMINNKVINIVVLYIIT